MAQRAMTLIQADLTALMSQKMAKTIADDAFLAQQALLIEEAQQAMTDDPEILAIRAISLAQSNSMLDAAVNFVMKNPSQRSYINVRKTRDMIDNASTVNAIGVVKIMNTDGSWQVEESHLRRLGVRVR
jgi:hypothetical protein